MLRCTVLRPIDDAQVLPPSAFDCWLHQTTSVLRHKLNRLYHHALASRGGEFFPPCNGRGRQLQPHASPCVSVRRPPSRRVLCENNQTPQRDVPASRPAGWSRWETLCEADRSATWGLLQSGSSLRGRRWRSLRGRSDCHAVWSR